MSFANLNLLPLALSLVPPTPLQYRKAHGVTVNEFGQAVTQYDDWKDGFGIVVPNGRQTEDTEGISFSKSSVTVYIRGVNLSDTKI